MLCFFFVPEYYEQNLFVVIETPVMRQWRQTPSYLEGEVDEEWFVILVRVEVPLIPHFSQNVDGSIPGKLLKAGHFEGL